MGELKFSMRGAFPKGFLDWFSQNLSVKYEKVPTHWQSVPVHCVKWQSFWVVYPSLLFVLNGLLFLTKSETEMFKQIFQIGRSICSFCAHSTQNLLRHTKSKKRRTESGFPESSARLQQKQGIFPHNKIQCGFHF